MNEIRKGKEMFYVGKSEEEYLAVITYKKVDDKTIKADHTFVSEQLRGQGIAKKLLNELVSFARENGYKIIPECSYVKKVFENSAEYRDIIKI